MEDKIILLSGRQGSGKSSIQKILNEIAVGRGFDRAVSINFADAIYSLHDSILIKLLDYGIQRDIKKDGVLLQLLGTEWGRKTLGEDIWVKILKQRVGALSIKGAKTLFIIGDCRFRNEFDAFPNALRIRLFASEEIRKKRTESWRENTLHPSEIDLDEYADEGKFDIFINTDGDVGPNSCAEIILGEVLKINKGLE